MSLLAIRTYPEEVLRKKSLPIENINGELQRLIDDMFETMYAAPGVGLAAPQVAVLKRLLVIDVSLRDQEKNYPPIVLINPEIVSAEGELESEEGCLSLPGLTGLVPRAEKIFVKGIDREEKPLEIEAEGLFAIALQHEIDHLEGKLIFDKMSPLKRSFYKKKIAKKSSSQ
jgi:peptide deformylase